MNQIPSAKEKYKVLVGDALTVLKTLPDECVHCCVTSPPYYGLRDYGTGTWEGGKKGCDHKGEPFRTKANINANCGTGTDDKNATDRQFFKEVCGKCGAKRVDSQLGMEPTLAEYVANMTGVFREVRRVLKPTGTCWVNLGDSYAGAAGNRNGMASSTLKGGSAKFREGDTERRKRNEPVKSGNLLGVPWRTALSLQEDGWVLRQDIIWAKPNPMPESVTSRCTKSHEYVFLLTKGMDYYFDADSIKEDRSVGSGGWQSRQKKGLKKAGNYGDHEQGLSDVVKDTDDRNRRSVWTVATQPYPGSHFAVFPPKLIEPMILAGCPRGGIVLDPFAGSGTTLAVAVRNFRRGLGIELNPKYATHLIPQRVFRRNF